MFTHKGTHSRCLKLFTLLTVVGLSSIPGTAQDWPIFGQDLQNSANNTASSNKWTAAQASQLQTNWTFTTGGDVSARAAVVNGVVYFPDWGGNLWALNARNGKVVWSHQFSDYGVGPAGTSAAVSRATPAVVGGVVYIGTQAGAYLLAINAANGKLIWKTQLESSDPFAIATASVSVANGVVYAGVASTQEAIATPGFHYTGRGSVVALDASSGSIKWKTYTTPVGYSGAGVWGSNPVVDKARNTVYVGTGDNYQVPDPTAPSSQPSLTYSACMAVAGATADACQSPDNHVDSVLALDLTTGAVKWSQRLTYWHNPYYVDGTDYFNLACLASFIP
ncbi:MAG: PQQ-binding-like beta-propeller repeat protein, partial [Acidobacteriota bacterium]|nr:PQQ-binding-like beta-propeller repeat protein [Acidobacteriota bacterium]